MDYPNFVFNRPDVQSRALRRTARLWRLGRFVARVPVLPFLAHWLASVMPRWTLAAKVVSRAVASERAAARAAADPRRRQRSAPTAFGSGFGYATAEEELAVVKEYERQIEEGKEWVVESGHVYAISIKTCGDIIQKNKVDFVLNFGVCYGYVDNVLAGRYPATKFVGIDRAEATKIYNEGKFDRPNLTFSAGDILDFLAAQHDDGRRKLFLHIRTACLLPEDFVRGLYRAARAAGYTDVVGVEPWGMSRETFGLMEMTAADRASLPFRAGMLLHNYQGLLEGAGFALVRNRYLVTNHGDPDYRLQVMEAERR